MIVANICERWGMTLQPPAEGDEWFLDWVLRSPKEVSGHLAASWHAYLSLTPYFEDGEIEQVREYFGGMGAHALMIQELFAPTHHIVMDYSPDAVAHLQRVLDPPAQAMISDAYDSDSTQPADLVALDFGDLTVWKTREGEPHRELLDRVFAHHPRAVTITDIAGPRLHLQRERYETLLGVGTCATYEGYLEALAYRMGTLYDYTLVAGYTHRWSTVMAFVPSADNGMIGSFHPIPASPIGLELL